MWFADGDIGSKDADGMEEVEKREFGRQLETSEQAASPDAHAALRLLASNSAAFLRQGSIVVTYRYRDGRKFGPYYCLNYREEGKKRSVYLGRAGELVEQVRQKLEAIQRPLVEFRQWNKLERQARRSFRLYKRDTSTYLQLSGLRWKGNIIRGWRNSPLCQYTAKSGRRLPPLVKPLPRLSYRTKTQTAPEPLACRPPMPNPMAAMSVSRRAPKPLAKRARRRDGRVVAKARGTPKPVWSGTGRKCCRVSELLRLARVNRGFVGRSRADPC